MPTLTLDVKVIGIRLKKYKAFDCPYGSRQQHTEGCGHLSHTILTGATSTVHVYFTDEQTDKVNVEAMAFSNALLSLGPSLLLISTN